MEPLVPVLGPLEAEGVSARGRPVHPPVCSGLMAAPVGAAFGHFLPAFVSRKMPMPI